jgi:hypothetical protein
MQVTVVKSFSTLGPGEEDELKSHQRWKQKQG